VSEFRNEIEVLVNNAGVGVWGPFKTTEIDEEVSMIQLNAIAPVVLTKLFLPDLLDRGKGRILFTASQASVGPLALAAVYGATKAFIYSFALALREELKESNVTVTSLLPGATDTDWFERAGAGRSETAQGDLADPADVARAGVEALLAGDDHVVAPLSVKAQVAVSKLMPDASKVTRLS
jgi:short-subunit dehydrogenase